MTSIKKVVDLDLSFEKQPNGDIAIVKDREAIIKSVSRLARFGKFDVPYKPDAGADLNRVIFDNGLNFASIVDAEVFIKHAISIYEPRARVISVELVNPESKGGDYELLVTLNINIEVVAEPVKFKLLIS